MFFAHLFVSLHHRLTAHSWAAGGLIYEKDVFERLSLWNTNLASSEIPQQADDNETSTWYVSIYLILYSPYWRGLMSVVYPVWVRQCESLCSQDGQKNRHLRLFCISAGTRNYGLIADSGVFGRLKKKLYVIIIR